MAHARSTLALRVLPVLLVALVGLAGVASSQSAFDPQSLVGEWTGEWRDKVNPTHTKGPYVLTIDKVEGNKVHGHVVARGVQGNVNYKFNGTVNGTQLTWTAGNATVVLAVDQANMTGTSSGGRVNSDITLAKKK